jgi:hydroxymethylbilane synthase
VLAAAGLARLGLNPPRARVFTIEEMLPAVGQGAIAILARADDERVNALLSAIDDGDTRKAVLAERAFLEVLDGSCRSPIAGHARFANRRVRFDGLAASEDGAEHYRVTREGRADDAEALARNAAAEIRARASPAFLKRYLSGG